MRPDARRRRYSAPRVRRPRRLAQRQARQASRRAPARCGRVCYHAPLTAFGPADARRSRRRPPARRSRLLPAGRPSRDRGASAARCASSCPSTQSSVTAIGYHGAGEGALALDPLGSQANEGLLARLAHGCSGGGRRLALLPARRQDGPPTSALNVGAAPGTDVYSPVDGTIVGIATT